ncbi:MAG TPA: hypothetical protein PKW80_15820 [Bacteroidales bacterium]|nr:hypothetical protein [Bacteroidales bacterium]
MEASINPVSLSKDLSLLIEQFSVKNGKSGQSLTAEDPAMAFLLPDGRPVLNMSFDNLLDCLSNGMSHYYIAHDDLIRLSV